MKLTGEDLMAIGMKFGPAKLIAEHVKELNSICILSIFHGMRIEVINNLVVRYCLTMRTVIIYGYDHIVSITRCLSLVLQRLLILA